MQTVDSLPGDIEDIPTLVTALNQRIDQINSDFQQSASASKGVVAPQPTEGGTGGGASEGNAWTFSNPDTNVYDFLDPLFEAIRQAQILVSQAQISANAVGTTQLQVGAVTANTIAANSVYAGAIQAGAVTATKINVSTLSAISANLGTITAGNITVDTSGFIRGGQTAYNTGAGFWLGYVAGSPGAYKFSIGDGSTNYLTWNGTTLAVSGTASYTAGTIGGWTIGATTITGGNVTLNSTGVITVGTGNNVVVLSSVDSTYRLWAGNASSGSAPFTIDKQGNVASTGSFTSTGASTYLSLAGNIAMSDAAGHGATIRMDTGSVAVGGSIRILGSVPANPSGTGGTVILDFNNAGANQFAVTPGGSSIPPYTFTTDLTTGMYLKTTFQIGWCCDNFERMVLTTSGLSLVNCDLILGNAYHAGTSVGASGSVAVKDKNGSTVYLLCATSQP